MFSFMLKNKTQSFFVGSVATLSYSVGILVIYLHSIGTGCLLSCVLSFKQDIQGLNRNDSTTDDSSSDDGDDADTPSTSKKKDADQTQEIQSGSRIRTRTRSTFNV